MERQDKTSELRGNLVIKSAITDALSNTMLNPFVSYAPFFYPLKISENLMVT